jgi:hypothetical protein
VVRCNTPPNLDPPSRESHQEGLAVWALGGLTRGAVGVGVGVGRRVVHALCEGDKKRLLFFTTGSDRVPIKGLANLPFIISRNGADSARLPTAHTCFNHLLLPGASLDEGGLGARRV